jgi:hypothetical protein
MEQIGHLLGLVTGLVLPQLDQNVRNGIKFNNTNSGNLYFHKKSVVLQGVIEGNYVYINISDEYTKISSVEIKMKGDGC